MATSNLIKYFFASDAAVDPEGRFNLNRRTRRQRIRQIFSTLSKHHFLKGFTPVEFRRLLEDLGPSFVKVGQTLSTRSEILPKAYCDELAKLQTDCDPLPFDEIIAALRDIYGDRFDKIFAEIDEHPLGSASLAQVHRARLVDGEVVAVKVQRPGSKATMALDIDIMRIFARRATRFIKDEQMLDLNDVVEEMWKTFLEETDFVREAQNLQTFHRLNKDCVYVDCPKVRMDLCGEYVLVMEYVEGIPIYDRKRLRATGYNLAEIGTKLLDNYASQILDHGFFHADPHPGNIIIRGGKIVYIDLGIMGRLTPVERAGFGSIIRGVGLKDSAKLKDALISFAVQRDNGAIDHTRFLADLDMILESYGSCDVDSLDVGQLLTDVLALTRMSRVMLPTSITNVARGIVAIEGTVAGFIPNDNIVNIINRHIESSTDKREDLQEKVKDMAVDLRRAAEGAIEAAQYSGETFKMITRGQVKLNMEVLGSDAPMATLSKIMNRLTLGTIIAGLFIGSAMYAEYGIGPRVGTMPLLSFLGFVGAFILSVWVVVDIWRRH